MSDQEPKELFRHATRIFMRLREDPDCKDAQDARDAFIARGDAERKAYDGVLKAWKATGVKQPDKAAVTGKTTSSMVVIAALILTGYMAYSPLRTILLADFRSELTTSSRTLASGDRVDLDASSALQDNTGGAARDVELLAGSAFFAVEAGEVPFTVSVGDVDVRVVGTAFETTLFADSVSVTVQEGLVDVVRGETRWELAAGDRLTINDSQAAVLEDVDGEAVASWRMDRLAMDDMTLQQVAEILDRRLPGRVIVVGDRLSNATVTGSLDLSNPGRALRALAAPYGGQVVTVTSLLAVLYPR
ncbi:MAG: FecR domain-containing protein [Pseudomonadota bacterium]